MSHEKPDRFDISSDLKNLVPVAMEVAGDGLDTQQMVVQAAQMYIESTTDHLSDADMAAATPLAGCYQCSALYFMLANAVRAHQEHIERFIVGKPGTN